MPDELEYDADFWTFLGPCTSLLKYVKFLFVCTSSNARSGFMFAVLQLGTGTLLFLKFFFIYPYQANFLSNKR
jgi:hypothetical protein